jgi:hypothetical protein
MLLQASVGLLVSVQSRAVASSTGPLLGISFADDASFNVSLAGTGWLESAPIRAFHSGAWQNLTRTGVVHSAGADVLGEFSCANVSWSSGGRLVLHTSLKTYKDRDTAIFVQQLPHGASGTNASNPVLPGNVRIMDPGN